MKTHRFCAYASILHTSSLHYDLNDTRAFYLLLDIEFTVLNYVYETQEFI